MASTFAEMIAAAPEDVYERAGYWRGNAGALSERCDELLAALKAIFGAQAAGASADDLQDLVADIRTDARRAIAKATGAA